MLIINRVNQQEFVLKSKYKDKWDELEKVFGRGLAATSTTNIEIGGVEVTLHYNPNAMIACDRVGYQASGVTFFRGNVVMDVDNEEYRTVLKNIVYVDSLDNERKEEYKTIINKEVIEYEIV